MSDFFQFKQFKVYHQKSSMKVGTDGVLLGCYAEIGDTKRILDIGCGSGVISLIAAQKSQADIIAIDIHKASAKEAQENFNRSPWRNQLQSKPISVQDFSLSNPKAFDVILSNPPFFENSMKSISDQRNLARHTDTLNSEDLLNAGIQLLNTQGIISIIMPIVEGEELIRTALTKGYFLKRKLLIFPKASKAANRLIIDLCRYPSESKEDQLIIRKENNEYTQEYRNMTKDFYLAF